MGLFDDPNAMMQLGMGLSQAGGNMAAPPSYIPTPLLYSMAKGASAFPAGMKGAQEYQTNQLALERMQAMQPHMLEMIKNSFGGIPGGAGSSGGGSVADQQFQQAYTLAMMSGKTEDAAKVLQSWAEHNPALAGQIKGQQADNDIYKTAQGTYVRGTSAVGNTNPPGPFNPPAMSPQGQGGPVVLNSSVKSPLAADGKSVLPNQTNLFNPDPSGTPKYKTDNTETGVNQTKLFQADDTKANEAFTANAASLQNEQFRLKELTEVYKQVQAGTLTAQNPELINKLVAWGVIKNPSDLKDLAGVQNALQSHALQIIQQIKDTNASLGGAPTRTFGSEIQNLQEQGESPSAQPEALWNIIGQARGIVDHHLDMVSGWDKIGGLGNRAANGYTLRPDDYARQFIGSHDISDYKTSAQKTMGPFKGMVGNGGKIHVVSPDGKTTGYIDPSHKDDLIKAGGKVIP